MNNQAMEQVVDQGIHHSSLSNIASDWIAQRILDGSIAPGQKVTEVWLADQMGISRSPVREALRLLSRDGLVVIEPRRGARVGELDAKHAEDLYASRLIVEPRCTRLAVEAMHSTRRRQLETLLSRMEQTQQANDASGYVTALQEYSLKLLDGCPNRILFGLAETTWRGSLRYWNLLVRGRSDYIEQSLFSNGAVHEAALQGDAAGAERLVATLLETSRKELKLRLNNLPPPGDHRLAAPPDWPPAGTCPPSRRRSASGACTADESPLARVNHKEVP